MLSERLNGDRVVRRRTSQVEIAFDLYMRQLRKTRPDISFFFTNHVASSMHRYWPTVFPEDYEVGKFDANWRKQWAGEIPHAIKVANYQLQKLLDYCDSNGSELIIASSMGQGAVNVSEPTEKEVLITNLRTLMGYLGLKNDDYEPKMAMSPQVMLSPKSEAVKAGLNKLKNIFVNGQNIHVFETSTGDIRLELCLVNQSSLSVFDGDTQIDPRQIGIDNVHLQDASSAYAYHIPEGILIHYKAGRHVDRQTGDTWHPVSALDFAPSLMKKFALETPSYMQKENLFLA